MSDSVLATTDSSLPMSRGGSFPRLIHPVQSTFLYVKQFAKNRLIQKFDLTWLHVNADEGTREMAQHTQWVFTHFTVGID